MIKIRFYCFFGFVLFMTTLCKASEADRDPFQKNVRSVAIEGLAPVNKLQVINPHNEKLSLNFQDMPIADLLELLAEFKGINLILSDGVKGHISVHLKNVSWEQAMSSVLTMENLEKRLQGSILWIAPANEMAKQTFIPGSMENKLITLKYAKANELVKILQSPQADLLSSNGHAIADARTNTLWIKDSSDRLKQVRQYLDQVDIPVKQVLITARIVNIDTDSVTELGLKFGTVNSNTAVNSQALHMDMPLSVEDVGHFTVAIAKLGADTLLDLELSALEREGRAQIISNPELVTANHQPASIESGQEIPYQEKTSSGATNIAFKKAVLGLEVTPEITPDNKIWLNLVVNQDKISVVSIEGVPAISTQQMKTQILVNNGETIVLGGIYEESNSHSKERIPFWGSIPVLGALFTHKETRAERKELLIFVSPKVL